MLKRFLGWFWSGPPGSRCSVDKRHFRDLLLGLELGVGVSCFCVVPIVVQEALLRPLEVHARLQGKILQHFLLLGRQGGHGAGGGCGRRHDERFADFRVVGLSDEQLVVPCYLKIKDKTFIFKGIRIYHCANNYFYVLAFHLFHFGKTNSWFYHMIKWPFIPGFLSLFLTTTPWHLHT